MYGSYDIRVKRTLQPPDADATRRACHPVEPGATCGRAGRGSAYFYFHLQMALYSKLFNCDQRWDYGVSKGGIRGCPSGPLRV